jgi:hypothetical protein
MTNTTTYLRQFIEGVADVPKELERHFKGIRELDQRCNELQQRVDIDCLAELQEAAHRQAEPASKRAKTSAAAASTGEGEPTSEISKRVQHNIEEIIRLSEEKLSRAQQIYDFIDGHIRKLDKDLQAFDADIAKERQRLGLPPAPGTTPGSEPTEGKRRQRKDGAPPAPLTDEELYQIALAHADETEPTYCYCKRISYGEMIACENSECPIEWFHFGCVGLTPENRPKGKWYCKECKRNMVKVV